VSQDQKWDPVELRQDFSRYQQLSAQHPEVTLLIWPETAVAAFPEQLQPELGNFAEQLQHSQQGLLVGLPVWGEHGRYYNAVRGLGLASGEYRKQHLVPFGEYLPFASVLQGLTEFFDLPMSGFSAGPRQQPLLSIEQDGFAWALGALICYEVAYPGLARRQAAAAHVLVVLSNDAWFGRSWAPAQHLQISRIRAIENQRAMVRATQNGISAFITPNGDILAQTEQFVATTLSGSVPARQGQTPYQHWGEWPLALIIASLLLIFGWQARQSKSGPR
jgi:apolipoprotein N-acyltransferase